MNPPSEEQNVILNYLPQKINIIVDACAGSGKSTTILSAAKQYPSCKFIQLTYNTLLKEEVKEKVKELELENISVYTYHSLALKYYAEAFDDAGLRHILREKLPPSKELPPLDVLVLDEAQDMTPLLFEFIVKFTLDIGKPFQLLILGDKRQGLYEFKGSYTGYLTMADKMWENHPHLHSKGFAICTLNTSYRITNPMADFVNQVMLDETRLLACKSGPPVRYIRREPFFLGGFVITNIKRLIAESKASYGDFFILAGSLKSYEIKKIENDLVQAGIPCYISMMENRDQLDTRVIENKVVFSTFHSVKGRQRRFVFVVGFDIGSLYHSERDGISVYECPNTLYVATTRASEGLFLLENEKEQPLPFLKKNHAQMQKEGLIEFTGNPLTMVALETEEKKKKKDKIKKVTPTQLVQFLSEDLLDFVTPLVDEIFIPIDIIEKKELDIPSILQTKTGFEEISDLNGNVLPIMFYDHLLESGLPLENKTKKCVFQQLILSQINHFTPKEHTFLKEIVQNMPETCESTSDYLYLANLYLAIEEKLYSKISQIEADEYQWLSDSVIQQCYDRLDTVLQLDNTGNSEWIPEKQLIHCSANEDHIEIDHCLIAHLGDKYLFRFTARVDLWTENAIWEWKCTSKLTVEHKIQLVIYAWLWHMVYSSTSPSSTTEGSTSRKVFRLFNIKTGEMFALNATVEQLTTIVVAVIKAKYQTKIKKIEKDYVETANSLFSNESNLI
jgi:hypothetical protein